jgi:hypothetical protein
MDIIKYINNNLIKNGRNIIIYDKNKRTNMNDKWMNTTNPIYKIYYGHAYNPPYFDVVVVFSNTNTEEDVKLLWNMVVLNGNIIIRNNKLTNSFFKNNIIKENNDFLLIKKNNNITYQFKEYRILDFIIAGTMKGGTTAAITNFSKHPDISMVEKEIHYFDRKKNYQKGTNWYKSHFDYSKKMVGDKAPDVMYQYSCLELLQIVNPQVKIILFLRNPIDRAYSHWKMLRDKFNFDKSFEESVNDEIKHRWNENTTYNVSFIHFVQRGLYFKQIQNILKYFPQCNIHILISENVKTNMNNEYQKVFIFLGLKEHRDDYVQEFVSKSSDTIDKKSLVYKKLKKIYRNDVKLLEKFLGYKTGWW